MSAKHANPTDGQPSTSTSTSKSQSTPPSSHNSTAMHHQAPKSLRPYVYAIMAHNGGISFQARHSQRLVERQLDAVQKDGQFATTLKTLFVGLSAVFSSGDDNENANKACVAIAIHDSTYLIDFCVQSIASSSSADEASDSEDAIVDWVVRELDSYARKDFAKFIGAGVPRALAERCPSLCSRLWLGLDIVPVLLGVGKEEDGEEGGRRSYWNVKSVDEQADSMARKCIMYFGPRLTPILQVGYRGIVQVDAGCQARLVTLSDFERTCGHTTWSATMKYANSLKQKKTKIAFFSSTPQGGGVALMRHALVRFARLVGVDLTWYVPKPKPGVFRITKNVHNILQGVSKPDERISSEDKQTMAAWIQDNADRYWLSEGGPLRPPGEGGADVIFIDDPQMPYLIPMIKNLTPVRPVLYRSHIQIRGDLATMKGTPQADIWDFLWQNIKEADMFISHPIPSFVPANVPREKVAFLPATTDWLDGLNKTLDEWNLGYYGSLYNRECRASRTPELKWPARKYIVQIARFDPAKGIPDVVDSYAQFRKMLEKETPDIEVPQLVICGNGSVDDPDGSIVYDETISRIEKDHPHLQRSISVIRLEPNDQLLNTILSASHIVLQLSTREGFEVKVSEALHKGKPVIAAKAGGIPLQVQHGKNGYLVEPGDSAAVANHLLDLWRNDELYARMSKFAAESVSDEVGTVGNALSWFYLADELSNGNEIVPRGRWINDMAREKADVPYHQGENRLPREI